MEYNIDLEQPARVRLMNEANLSRRLIDVHGRVNHDLIHRAASVAGRFFSRQMSAGARKTRWIPVVRFRFAAGNDREEAEKFQAKETDA